MESASRIKDFTPRAYQDELVEMARKKNIICALGTGTGKTYIAVKLIQAFQHEIEGEWDNGGKRTVFVVPTVPLVEQQSRVMREFTGISTIGYVSTVENMDWTVHQWHDQFRKFRLIVIVHDTLRQLLEDAILPTERINLLVVDECHHAAKDHPYRKIMEYINRQSPNKQPGRILGLTASVINVKLKNGGKEGGGIWEMLEADIKELEKCMNCTVETTSLNMEQYGARPDPRIETYRVPPVNELTQELFDDLKDLVEWLKEARSVETFAGNASEAMDCDGFYSIAVKASIAEVRNWIDQISNTLKTVGPWCTYQTSRSLLKDLQSMHSQNIFNAEIIQPVQITIARLQQFGTMLEVYFQLLECKAGTTEVVLLKLVTPKVGKLLEILQKSARALRGRSNGNGTGDLCCIVFVRERYIAWALHQFFETLRCSPEASYKWIRTGFCVGQLDHSGSEESAGEKLGLSLTQLKSTLKRFSAGQINVLIATDVVEEGFDVRECNLVIRFDTPATYRSYVQSKGRARAKDSDFIMMIQEDLRDKFERTDLQQFQMLDAKLMKEFCRGRSGPTAQERDEHFEKDLRYPPFAPRGTQAIITVHGAIQSLQRYCNELPNDNMAACLVHPKYSNCGPKSYKCTLHLPLNAAIKEPVTGAVMANRTDAKKVAALECCKRLYELKELDPENLLPVTKEKWLEEVASFTGNHAQEQTQPGEPKPGTQRRVQYYAQKTPLSLKGTTPGVGVQSFLYVIRLTVTGDIGSRDFGLKEFDPNTLVGLISCRKFPSLPSWPLYNALKSYMVQFDLVGQLVLSDVQLSNLRICHHTIFTCVLGCGGQLLYDPEKVEDAFIAVPLKRHSGAVLVDWAAVERFCSPDQFVVNESSEADRRNLVLRPEKFVDSVVATWYRGTPMSYFVVDIKKHLDPFTITLEKPESSADYMARTYKVKLQQKGQPMLELQHCSKSLNFLKPKTHETREAEKQRALTVPPSDTILVPAELCQILPLSAQLYQTLRILPSAIHRLQSFCRTLDLYTQLRLQTKIGIKVPQPSTWKPLVYDFRFQNIYESKVPPGYLEFEMDVEMSFPEDSPSPESESSSSSSMDTDGNELMEHGVFYDQWKSRQHYKRVRARQGARNISLGLWPSAPKAPSVTASSLVPITLVDPPFWLDAGFSQNFESIPFPEITSLLTASTTKNAHDGFNMERLETMGDSFLKMISCIYLFLEYASYHEGRLSYLKDQQVSNRNLYQLAKVKDIPSYISDHVLEPTEPRFMPPGFRAKVRSSTGVDPVDGGLCPRTMQAVRDKSVADVVEALIGLILLETNARGAQQFMEFMGLKAFPTKCTIGCRLPDASPSPLLRDKFDPVVRTMMPQLCSGFAAFEQRIGYTFREKAYLLQAFSHNSYIKNRITDCYQRLEFLGDGILDFLVTRYLYEDKACFDPGRLSDLRQAMVNNKTFSRLAVEYNYHNHIRYFSPKILGLIDKYVTEQRTLDPKIEKLSQDVLQKYHKVGSRMIQAIRMVPSIPVLLRCNSTAEDVQNILGSFSERQKKSTAGRRTVALLAFDTMDDEDNENVEGYEIEEDPKTLGDVFESVAGAIFLDSGLSLDAVWKVYYNMMRKRLELYVKKCPLNPVRELLEMVPDNCHFAEREILKNGKIRVAVEVSGRKTFYGIGNNYRAAKCSAAKHALDELRAQ